MTDGNIFDPNYVFSQDVASFAKTIANMNIEVLGNYLRAYRQVKLEWNNQKVKRPLPAPGKLAQMEVDHEHYTLSVTLGPELVTAAKPAPWDIPVPQQPADQIIVGALVGDGIYATERDGQETTVAIGTKTIGPTGPLVLVELGKFGTLWYRKLWIPTERGI